MTKSHPFSIYLLKTGFSPSNALEENSKLDGSVKASKLPKDSELFVLGEQGKPLWWEKYFGIDKRFFSAANGALVFIPIDGRWFALPFGHVYHNLKDESFEYDFGLRATLNCLDLNLLKSTDTHEPGTARRRKTQIPSSADLTFFDFDSNSNILTSLTGKVKSEHKELIKNATGGNSFKCSCSLESKDLHELLKKLLELYESESYLEVFPSIQNITPVSDPVIKSQLNDKLLKSLQEKDDDNLYLTVPDIINYEDNLLTKFTGLRGKNIYEDVYLENYYSHLEERGTSLNEITIEDLKTHKLQQVDENEVVKKGYTLWRCFVFDTKLEDTGKTYHFNDGNWYKIQDDYVASMKAYLDPLCIAQSLPNFDHCNEGAYNKAIAANDSANYLCLDTKNISPEGSTQIEPCDLYSSPDGQVAFIHVKRSTHSQQLSHLFNQGINSAEAIRLIPKSLEKLNELVDSMATNGHTFSKPSSDNNFNVVYAIITHKDASNKSDNLPLFSRISLMRTLKHFKLMNIDASYQFVVNKKTDA